MTPQKKIASVVLISLLVAGVILLILFLVAKLTEYNIPYITPLVKGSTASSDDVVNPADEVATVTTTTSTTVDDAAAAQQAAAATQEAAAAASDLQPDVPSLDDGVIGNPTTTPASDPVPITKAFAPASDPVPITKAFASASDPVAITKPFAPDPVAITKPFLPPSTKPFGSLTEKTKVKVTAVSSEGGGKYFRVNAAAFDKMLNDNGIAPTGTWDPAGKYWMLNVYRRRGDEASGMTVILWNNKGTQRYSPATSTPQYHGRVEPHGGITFKPGDELKLDNVQTPQ